MSDLEAFKGYFKFADSTASDILTICEPIFNTFKITYFCQTRIYPEGPLAALLTNPAIGRFWLQQKYAIGVVLESGYYFGAQLGDLYPKTQQDELREHFNIDHLLFIIDKCEHYTDVYILATTPENGQILNYYLNYREIVEQFILHYKNKTKKLITQASRPNNCLIIPYQPTNVSSDIISQELINSLKTEAIFKNHLQKKPTHPSYIDNIGFSKRESDCLSYFIRGYTVKEIAKQLQLAPSTVNEYINNAKVKSGCHKKSQLIEYVFTKLFPEL